MGNAQRLLNGNTLITESSGRFFEVTREGATVWEYINPFFDKPSLAVSQTLRATRSSQQSVTVGKRSPGLEARVERRPGEGQAFFSAGSPPRARRVLARFDVGQRYCPSGLPRRTIS